MLSDLPRRLHQNATIWENSQKSCFEYACSYSQEFEILAETWKWEESVGPIFPMKTDMDKAKQFQKTT